MSATATPAVGRRGELARGAALIVGLLLLLAGGWLLLAASWRVGLIGGGLAAVGLPLVWFGLRAAKNRRRAAGLLAVNALALLAFFVLLAASPLGRSPARNKGDPELGWAPILQDGRVGMREEPIDLTRPRLLFIGDSIVFGHGVQADQTMTRALERLLPGWQVLNAGVQGYSPDQELVYLRRIIGEVKPHVVLVGAYTGNDFSTSGREFSWGHSKPLFILDKSKDPAGELVRIDRAGACIDRVGNSPLFRLFWHDKDRAARLIETLCTPLALNHRQTREVIAASYVGMDALAKSHGAKLLHVLMQEQREYHVDGYRPNEYLTIRLRGYEIARLVHAGDHPVLETFAILGQDPAVAAKAYLEDHAHLTAFGHEVLAKAIAKRLAEPDFAIGPNPGPAYPAAGPAIEARTPPHTP